MTTTLKKYKGFTGSITVSVEDNCLHGKIECINDLVTYESNSVKGLKEEFHAAVDDYIEMCKELGLKPNKPMSGSFNIRIGSKLHEKAYLESKTNDISLNDFVKSAIEEKLHLEQSKNVHNHFYIGTNKTEKKNHFTAEFENLTSYGSYSNSTDLVQ